MWLRNFCCKKQSSILCLRNIFRPLFILLSILGLFPFSINFRNSNSRFIVIQKSIYLNLVCALAYVIIICFFLVMHIRHIYFSFEKSSLIEGIMTQLNYIVELFNITAFCVVTYISVFINRYKYVKILNVLASRIDPPNLNSEKVLNNLRFHINVVALGCIALTSVMQICVNFTRADSLWKIILVMFTFNLPQLIQFTYVAFFYILMMMIAGLLKNIRVQMSVLAKKKSLYTDGLTVASALKRIPTLRQMEIIYVEASDMKQTTNQVFKAPILITMMQCFHSIVSESHIIYHGLVVQRNFDIHAIVNCSIWIIYQVIKVYAISCAGNAYKLEMSELGRAVHSIPTERQDLRFMLEVQHFSSTMSFHGHELTVYGFFSLDATLIFKTVAAAAMYVIILVQFDKSK